jgi:hypothetical protein
MSTTPRKCGSMKRPRRCRCRHTDLILRSIAKQASRRMEATQVLAAILRDARTGQRKCAAVRARSSGRGRRFVLRPAFAGDDICAWLGGATTPLSLCNRHSEAHRSGTSQQRSSYPAHAGYPVPRLLGSIADVSGILDHPPSRMTTSDGASRNRNSRMPKRPYSACKMPLESDSTIGSDLHARSIGQAACCGDR